MDTDLQEKRYLVIVIDKRRGKNTIRQFATQWEQHEDYTDLQMMLSRSTDDKKATCSIHQHFFTGEMEDLYNIDPEELVNQDTGINGQAANTDNN